MTTKKNNRQKTGEEEFYTLGKVAGKLGLSRMTVYRYVVAKELPAYKFGCHYRVKKKDLDAFIISRKV